jgi:hypothetical protein
MSVVLSASEREAVRLLLADSGLDFGRVTLQVDVCSGRVRRAGVTVRRGVRFPAFGSVEFSEPESDFTH